MRFQTAKKVLITIVLLLVIIGAGSLFLWGVYANQWDGPFVTRISNILPIPAGRVGSRTVLMRDYLSNVHAIRRYLASSEAEQVTGVKREFSLADRVTALEHLMRIEAMKELADKRSIVISNEMIEEAITQDPMMGTKSKEELTNHIRDTYGWSLEEFQTYFVHPILLERQLSASYAADHGGNVNALSAYLAERLQEPDVKRYILLQ